MAKYKIFLDTLEVKKKDWEHFVKNVKTENDQKKGSKVRVNRSEETSRANTINLSTTFGKPLQLVVFEHCNV